MSHVKKQDLDPIQAQLNKLNRVKLWCRILVVLTIGVSVWANVLHAQTTPASILISALPPLIVLGGFEIISRVPMREKAKWLVRFARPAAAIGISGIGAYLSYRHQNDAFHRYADVDTARLLPIAIDGLMMIASISLIELSHHISDLNAEKRSQRIGLQRAEARVEQPVPRRQRSSSKRDNIIKAIERNPKLTDAELALMTNAHRNYVNQIRRELEKEMATA